MDQGLIVAATPRESASPLVALRRAIAALPEAGQAAALCLVLALMLRAPLFGNPVIHVDEQLYLVIADRMLHGQLPYVDVWDRKPIGLFLIFAAARALGGDGVVQYQALAALFAAATGLVVWRIARQVAAHRGALIAAGCYLAYLSLFDNFGGQGPVFYNLPMALAALQVCRAVGPRGRLARDGAIAMLLVGLAIQIKYTVVFEGIAFGLVLLARAWGERIGMARIALLAAGWIALALAPTALALGAYATFGHAGEFLQANFISVFFRQTAEATPWDRLLKSAILMVPFWLALVHAFAHPELREDGTRPAAWPVLMAWGGAAIAGYLVFGTWYDHYLGSVILPLAVLVAPALDFEAKVRWPACLLAGVPLVAVAPDIAQHIHDRGNRAQFEALAGEVRHYAPRGDLFVFDGEPMLYMVAGRAAPTRFLFPVHLNTEIEKNALGVDLVAETRRIMATRPSAVVISVNGDDLPLPNHATRGVVEASLAADYARVWRGNVGARRYDLYARRR